jgi:hypothetical protein
MNQEQQPWWNRPIYLRDLIGISLPFQKEIVPEDLVALHNRALIHAQNLAKPIESVDSDKFGNPEFLLFAKIRVQLAKGEGVYQGLKNSIDLLEVAINAKDNYLLIEQVELRYRGTKQQEFYNYVLELLSQDLSTQEFLKKIKQKLAEILPLVKTEQGRKALKAYANALKKLSEDKLGLKLLALFKQYELADYSILRNISETMSKLHKEELHNLKSLVITVRLNYEVYQRMGKIIGVRGKRDSPETYARMLQFLAMKYKHAIAFVQFEQLLGLLQQWEQPFGQIVPIREEYKPQSYKQPKEFKQEIPGLAIYQKYNEFFI